MAFLEALANVPARGRVDTSVLPTTPGAQPEGLMSGRWSITFTPTYDTSDGFTWQVLFGTGDSTSGLFIAPGGTSVVVYDNGSPLVNTNYIEYSHGASITVAVDSIAGTLEISGASSGNGMYYGTPWSWTQGQWQFGLAGGLGFPYFGAISDVSSEGNGSTAEAESAVFVVGVGTASGASTATAPTGVTAYTLANAASIATASGTSEVFTPGGPNFIEATADASGSSSAAGIGVCVSRSLPPAERQARPIVQEIRQSAPVIERRAALPVQSESRTTRHA